MLTDHNKFEYFPTDAELEILQILWKNGSATVREVFEQLALRKDIKYTTALKLMQIMHEKGLCSRVAQCGNGIGSTDAGKLPSDTERTEGNKIDDRETRKI